MGHDWCEDRVCATMMFGTAPELPKYQNIYRLKISQTELKTQSTSLQTNKINQYLANFTETER